MAFPPSPSHATPLRDENPLEEAKKRENSFILNYKHNVSSKKLISYFFSSSHPLRSATRRERRRSEFNFRLKVPPWSAPDVSHCFSFTRRRV